MLNNTDANVTDDANRSQNESNESSDRNISVTEQAVVAPTASVALDGIAPSEVWSQLLENDNAGLLDPLQEAVRSILAGTHHSKRERTLKETGVEAEHGALACVLKALSLGPQHTRHRDAVATLHAIGRPEPSPLGWQLDLEVAADVCAVLGTLDSPPVVEIVVSEEFRHQRRDQRRAIIELLVDLAQFVDIRLTGGPIELRWLAATHRAELPTSVTHSYTADRYAAPLEALVEEARSTLQPDSRAIAILRTLADASNHTRTYGQLVTAQQVSRSYVRRVVTEQLVPLDLVERIDHYGDAGISLLPAGKRLIDDLDAEIGRQQALGDCVTDPPNCSDNSRVSTREGEGGVATPPADGPSGAVSPDRSSDRLASFHQTSYLDTPSHATAAGAATDADISLVDTPIDPLEDAGARLWSYDDDRDELVVGAEYLNPLQWQVCIALACVDWRTFEHTLDDDRLEAVLETHPASILRDARNLGGLPEAALEDASQFRARLEEWREELIELTTRWRHEDYDDAGRFRGEITRVAHGLAGTMIHLLDLAGVEVVRLMRLPAFARDFSPNRDDTRREDLVETVVTSLAIQSRYGHHGVYRQLFEQRSDKRAQSLGVEVNAADPYGQIIGGLTIVGPGVDGLEDELLAAHRGESGGQHRGRLDTGYLSVHDDAPEFAVSVTIRATASRAAYSQVVQRVLAQKHLRPTQEAMALLRALTGTLWDVAKACMALSPETSRNIGLDEVRYGLSTLPPERILPSHPPTVGRMLHALLCAGGPLSRGELADRAGISRQSIRNHLESLEELELVVEDDRGLRAAIPWSDERYDAESVLPFYVSGSRPVAAVIYELAERRGGSRFQRLNDLEAEGTALVWPPDLEALRRSMPDLEPWVSILRGACQAPAPAPASAMLGPRPSQAAITAPAEEPVVSD